MKNLIAMLAAGVLAGTGAMAMAQNVTAKDQPNAGEEATKQQAADPANATQREQDYLAALKKCDAMTSNDKTKCIDAAKKKSGQM